MSILQNLNELLSPVMPVESGVFTCAPPDSYCVFTPLTDSYGYFADNAPQIEVSEVRISLFSKENYITMKNRITKMLLADGFTITGRRYVGHEDDTGYHHYAIDVAKHYELED